MLDRQSTNETLQAFSKYVIQQSRTNLTKGDKNVSKGLYDSLGSEVVVSQNSFGLSFKMADYGKFQDLGVKGVGGTKKDGTPYQLKNAEGSPYSYKDKMPPPKAFDKWIVKRGFAPRNTKGKFLSREGMKFAIAKSIYHRGIEKSLFFSRPFELGFERLPDEIVEAYGLDVEKFLKNTLK